MQKVLFLCVGNSCRSQMAEGWLREFSEGRIEPASAGTEPHGLDPRAVTVMAEAGVDISDHRSTGVDELPENDFDLVVTVCDPAKEACPALPLECRKLHRSFDDPPRLAEGAADEEEKLEAYRRVRDEIKDFVAELVDDLRADGKEN